MVGKDQSGKLGGRVSNNYLPGRRIGSAERVAFYLLVCAVSIYSAKLFLSPTYFIVGAACLVLFLWTCLRGFYWAWDIFVAGLLLVYIGVQIESFNGTYINGILAFSSYVIIRLYRKSIPEWFAVRLINVGAWFSLVVLFVDSVYRILHPTAPTIAAQAAIEESGSIFYLYKFGGLMFADSNTTAIVALCFLGALFKLKADNKKINGFLLAGLVLIVLLSFSRAGVIGLLLLLLLYRFRLGLFSLLLGSAVLAGGLYYFSFWGDGSLLSKFYIMKLLASYIQSEASVQDLIFGVGVGRSEDVFGMHTHILLVTYFVELGIVGFSLFLLFLLLILKQTKNMYLIIVPLIFVSMSYFLYLGAAFFTVPLALASLVKTDNRKG